MARAYFDDEGPTEHDEHLLVDDENDTVPCPECGKQILAFADRCHHCGTYFGKEAWMATRSSRQTLWVAVALIVAVVFLAVILGVF